MLFVDARVVMSAQQNQIVRRVPIIFCQVWFATRTVIRGRVDVTNISDNGGIGLFRLGSYDGVCAVWVGALVPATAK